MLVQFIKNDKIVNFDLPLEVKGSYWITDQDNNEIINLVNIEAKDGKWVLKSNADVQVFVGNAYQKSLFLSDYCFYVLGSNGKIIGYLWSCKSNDPSYKAFSLEGISGITIGKDAYQDIQYQYGSLGNNQAIISVQNNRFNITNSNMNVPLFINNKKVISSYLKCGDIIFIMGLKIIFMGKFIIVNNPLNLVKIKSRFLPYQSISSYADVQENLELSLYEKQDYFLKKPRFTTQFQRKTIKIDSPPNPPEENPKPAIYTIGPMATMGLVSAVTLGSAINGIVNEGKTIGGSITTIMIALAMLGTMLVWPVLSKRYDNKMSKRQEEKRQKKYKQYLTDKAAEIDIYMRQEKQIILENTFNMDACIDIMLKKSRHLWEREQEHYDFLEIRMGIGPKEPNLDIQYPEDRFTLAEDNLKELLASTVDRYKTINGVAQTISLTEKNKLAIIGEDSLVYGFIDSIILQIATLHSASNVKIVLFTDKLNEDKYEYLRILPHSFSDTKAERFFCTDDFGTKQIANYLEQIYNSRKYKGETNEIRQTDYKNFSPYYVIFVDNTKLAHSTSLINNILEDKINYGFSLIFRNNNLSTIPNECSSFIDIAGDMGKASGLFENDLVAEKQKPFVAELNYNNRINMYSCAQRLANIPMKTEKSEIGKGMPDSIDFLGMYNVGNIEQLNVSNRWINNNPIISLQTPIGIGETGDIFSLDLHEKFHGPHGLIAGMTGSGKSEFIITYVLSLAINYHPNEVQFVLIDYKGGGLAGAFENKETGMRLPHVAGTITNLDIVEMNRALNSIQSELRRRQVIFKQAKEEAGEGTMDIYKYQKMYRDGIVKTPVAHLFIISDEFAELKMQHPEFMDQLISTARIGRSLGVHLILATQKPGGIVNDQIWSNSKFKVCLKVQDRTDSMDMLKVPDAAYLKHVGRFYLQVGFNEFFAQGQAAFSGATYYPSETVRKHLNTSVDFINDIGYIYNSNQDSSETVKQVSQGEQLTNIVKYLSNLAKEKNIVINKLWLDRIPALIFVENLRVKYNYKKLDYYINPIIGEFDDPNNQRQGLLTLPLTKSGNTIIYGMAGSGKENLLTTLIYSSITTYTPSEVNFYIIDFGAETLLSFKDASQVGDVVISGEEEKLENLFRLLFTFIEQRKELLSKYNGSFDLYNQESNNKLPLITLIINNFEGFSESHEDITETLVTLTRSCAKYGIVVVMTANSVLGVRYRLSQNFKQILTLQLTNKSDYMTIVGKTSVFPSEIVGRGLIKLDDVYEFQTAYIAEKSKIRQTINDVNLKLKEKFSYKVMAIPILPSRVVPSLFNNYDIKRLPVGIDKESLQPVFFNFVSNYVTTVMGLSSDYFGNFVGGLNGLISRLSDTDFIVLDAGDIVSNTTDMNYYNDNFDDVINRIGDLLDTLVDSKHLIISILCYNEFKSSLSTQGKEMLKDIFVKGRELNVSFIIMDTVDEFKNSSLEAWYDYHSNNVGIWIGNGIAEQFALRVVNLPREARRPIGDSFGYVVNKANIHLVKLIEGEDDGK